MPSGAGPTLQSRPSRAARQAGELHAEHPHEAALRALIQDLDPSIEFLQALVDLLETPIDVTKPPVHLAVRVS